MIIASLALGVHYSAHNAHRKQCTVITYSFYHYIHVVYTTRRISRADLNIDAPMRFCDLFTIQIYDLYSMNEWTDIQKVDSYSKNLGVDPHNSKLQLVFIK